MDKKQLFAFIERASAKAESIAKEIWGYAELSLQEVRSADLYEKALREAGFEVTRGLWEIDTAVVGKYGSGSPVIGILGEYDALSGMSQKQLEAATGIDQSDISKIERGVANPSVSTLERIAKALGGKLAISIAVPASK